MFITFEGPEGCGKSTHVIRLKHWLEEKGHKVLLTREPGGTQVGKEIRKMLLQPEMILDETTEIYLFAADRSEHVSKIIRPALAEGKVVISDRFTDSTLAYQLGGRGLPEDLVRYVNLISAKGLIPDLTILFDVSPEVGLKRAGEAREADRFEKEKLDFHRKVRNKFLELAKNDPERIKVISTEDRNIDAVQADVRDTVEKFLTTKALRH